MYFTSVDEIPEHIQKYSDKVKSQWRHVFNTVYDSTADVNRATDAANAVLEKRIKGSLSKIEYEDNMTYLINRYFDL